MRKSKTFQIIVVIILTIILGALSIPKYHQIIPVCINTSVKRGII